MHLAPDRDAWRRLVADGFASQRSLDALVVVTDVEAALDACAVPSR